MPASEIDVRFTYYTGIRASVFRNVRLTGSWDDAGVASTHWTTVPMTEFRATDGCPAFRATVRFPSPEVGRELSWGVLLDGPPGADVWGIPTELSDVTSTACHRTFRVPPTDGRVDYHLTSLRHLGASKYYRDPVADPAADPAVRFAVWAPNAQQVDLVIGDPVSGYIYDDGRGVVKGPFPMTRDPEGVWSTDPADPAFGNFAAYDHLPYMFRVTRDDGSVRYRTDLYSRCQIGRGSIDPQDAGEEEAFTGRREDLDGTKGCSVVVDPERVTELFDEGVWPETRWLAERDFWRDEFDPFRPLPTRPEDLVIYEMHVGGLGYGRTDASGNPAPGTLADAVRHLDHLVDLGIDAVELLPMAEFEGWASWGYGSSHYFAVEFSGGGRDQLKHFVRECHRRGIAVILDVVYNHYHHQAERAQWAYDSPDPERNTYYWWEGPQEGHPAGYLDNMSTGYVPRYWDERVRRVFIDSAVMLAVEFHIDGFRVDQTTSMHAYAHRTTWPYPPVAAANAFGAKFLREWTRTLQLVKPTLMLVAEDHSEWSAVTSPTSVGGLGFDATWYSRFYHHLCGDATSADSSTANLLTSAAYGDDRPLAMSYFAGALQESANRKVVYHESHDEAGNSSGTGRTLVVAAGRAPLVGDTRRYAEARARFAAAMTLLSAGTPMFFMGEEVGFQEDYRYDDFAWHREDFAAERAGVGAGLFTFYRQLIRLRRETPALQSRCLEVVHASDANRVIGILRAYGPDEWLVVGSLANYPYSAGYRIAGVRDGGWQEVFNSDAAAFGGWNDGNSGAALAAQGGTVAPVLPRAGVVVLRRLP